MKFPLKENRNGKCLVCGCDMDAKFVYLNAGCLRVVNKRNASPFNKGEAECFMSLCTHNHEARDVSLKIIDTKSVKRGQFDLYFCSFRCASDFFVTAVNTLAAKYDNLNNGQVKQQLLRNKNK